jgi:hypothetical protein
MAVRIIPRVIRGRLFFQIGDIYFPTFAQAADAWSWSAAIARPFEITERGRA